MWNRTQIRRVIHFIGILCMCSMVLLGPILLLCTWNCKWAPLGLCYYPQEVIVQNQSLCEVTLNPCPLSTCFVCFGEELTYFFEVDGTCASCINPQYFPLTCDASFLSGFTPPAQPNTTWYLKNQAYCETADSPRLNLKGERLRMVGIVFTCFFLTLFLVASSWFWWVSFIAV